MALPKLKFNCFTTDESSQLKVSREIMLCQGYFFKNCSVDVVAYIGHLTISCFLVCLLFFTCKELILCKLRYTIIAYCEIHTDHIKSYHNMS